MAKFTGKGAQFLIKSSGATPAYVAIGQISEIGDISVTADEIDGTTLDAGDYRYFLQGFKDPGECQLTVVFDPAMADQGSDPDGLFGLFTSGQVSDIAIRCNSSGVGGEAFIVFQAFIRDWTFNALNPDDLQTVTPLFRLAGPITIEDTLPTTLTAGAPADLTAADLRRIADKAMKDANALDDAAKKAMAAAQVKLNDAEAAKAAVATAQATAAQALADECSKLQAAAAVLKQPPATPPATQV